MSELEELGREVLDNLRKARELVYEAAAIRAKAARILHRARVKARKLRQPAALKRGAA